MIPDIIFNYERGYLSAWVGAGWQSWHPKDNWAACYNITMTWLKFR